MTNHQVQEPSEVKDGWRHTIILFCIIRRGRHKHLLHYWMAFCHHCRLHRVTFHVGFQRLSWRKHFGADNATLGLVIVQSLDVNFQSVARPKLLAAFGTEVALVKVVFLNVVCQVCLICTEIVAHCATPTPTHAILSPHLHWHALDHMKQIWGKMIIKTLGILYWSIKGNNSNFGLDYSTSLGISTTDNSFSNAEMFMLLCWCDLAMWVFNVLLVLYCCWQMGQLW